jgi:hypothetical protein
MMIIVQTFTANNNIPRTNVLAFISSFTITIPPPMSNAVDHTCGPEWDPQHLYAPYYGANPTKDDDVEQKENANAKSGVSTV